MLIHKEGKYYFPRSDWTHDAPKWIREANKLDGIYPLLKDFSLALDIGGFCGVWADRMSLVFDRVITFEPIPENYCCLTRNVPPMVEKHLLAVGDECKVVGMDLHGAGFGHTSDEEKPLHRADMVSIDSLHLSPSFMKIDVDGGELEVLRGAKKTIRKCKPVICIETKGDRYHTKAITAMLVEYGYEFHHKASPDQVYIPC